MDNKLDFLTKDLIDQAVIEINNNGIPSNRGGTEYGVNIKNKQYPYKLIVTEAAKLSGINLKPIDFSSNANNRLGFEKLTGYTITNLNEKMEYFNLNDILNYNKDVGKKYDSSIKGAKTYFDTRSKLRYLGEQLGNDLGLALGNNYNEKPNKMAGKGKGFVLKEYILTGFLPKKYKNLGNSIFMKLSFHSFHSTPIFSLDVDVNFSDENNKFNKYRNELQKHTSWGITVDNTFPTDWSSLLKMVTPIFVEQLNYIENFLSNNKKMIEINKFIDILNYKKQIILQGPPGTGKTYTAKDIAEQLITGKISENKGEQAKNLDKSDQFELIQFHPSYTYEDFVRGIVAESNDGKVVYRTINKSLGEFAEAALGNYNLSRKDDAKVNNESDSKEEGTAISEKKYVLIIDEINRANLPSVLGELIYALEYRGQYVNSMYKLDNGDTKITIPKNLYIIGTMNTADRSVGHIDYAIRRRFAFKEVLPRELSNLGDKFKKEQFEEISKLFVKEIKTKSIELEASEHLSHEFADRPQDVWLGHSYFIEQEDEAGNAIDFKLRMDYEIIPILEEYIKDGILRNTKEVKDIIKGLGN